MATDAPAAERRMIMACKYETSNGRCGLKGCYAYRHKCYTEDMCKCHEPLTNADRIRAMSDEDLAYFLAYIWATSARAWQKDYGETLSWLQKEKEDDHGSTDI